MPEIVLPELKLGRLPKRVDIRSLDLAALLPETLPKAPLKDFMTAGIDRWPAYGNHIYGDCTIAALGHMVEIWTHETNGWPKLLDDAPILRLYEDVTGGPDVGANMLDVLHVMRKAPGLTGDTVYAYASVDPKNHDLVKCASWLFRGLYIGFNVPQSAIDQFHQQKPWIPVSGAAGNQIVGGHAVNVVGYDAAGVVVATWGELKRMSWGFWDKYVDEAWALLPGNYQTMRGPLQANGFDFPALEQYLQLIGKVNQDQYRQLLQTPDVPGVILPRSPGIGLGR